MHDEFYKLKTVMLTRRVSQKELAEVLGITQQALGNKLSSRTAFTLPEVRKTIKYLEISDPADIFLL